MAVTYAIVAWASIEVTDTVFPYLTPGDVASRVVIALAIIGFPIALALAWVYDLTPDGLARTENEAPQSETERTEAPATSSTAAAPSATVPALPDVQRVLTAALEQPASERAGFLDRACAGEQDLRREVESLLRAHDGASMLDRPASQLIPSLLRPRGEDGPARVRDAGGYQILDRLGGGGMGVVYRARDPRLGRTVALKFLSPHLSADPRAKERFMIEAQAAAALDHPNICTIHEIGETADGQLFIAMPFYAGEVLRQRIGRGPLPSEEAADIALQVARGLIKAQERGIVHRDIKPANIVVTDEGVVKIVDFGIAKLADVTHSSTESTPGTLAYMSPEQVRGEDVDGRTDLWSLGVVLYEMLTGTRPYHDAVDSAAFLALLENDPAPVGAVRPGVPLLLERVVTRALSRRPEDRFATAAEMAAALESVVDRSSSSEPGGGRPRLGHSAPADVATSGTRSAPLLPEGERRQATIVTATLSGFDDVVDTLVLADVEEVMSRLRDEAAEATSSRGGALNHFIGEELVLLFGIPAATEDDTTRAVRAALDLAGRVASLSEQIEARGSRPLRLHIGIDTGRVVAQESAGGERLHNISGSAVQRSARLAAQAGPGEVWVSSECHHRIAPFFTVSAQEPIAWRDRDLLVPYRVDAESGLHTRMEAAEKAGLTTYTGREAELAMLRRALSTAVDGAGQLVTVIGEAGMGKSRLLHEFQQACRDRQLTVLAGRCQSYGNAVAYLPFIEILRTGLDLAAADAATAAEHTVRRILEIAPDLDDFVPLYLQLLSIQSPRRPVPRHLQGDALRLAMQEALVEILTRTARGGPVVVLLEDWHWADEASHSVLTGLAEVVSDFAMLIVVTCRPGYDMELRNAADHAFIPLRPLEPMASAEMLRSLLEVDWFPEELGVLLHERTGGNPFFLEEICQALVEDGALVVDGRAAQLSGPLQMLDLPDSVQAVIRARLDHIDRRSRDVLRLAAVVGREFTGAVIERALPDRAGLQQSLDTLKGAGLIQQIRVGRAPAYRFKHILTQEVAYGSLLEHQRRDLHGRVGVAIEEVEADRIDDSLERLSHHFSRAEAWDRAVMYALHAAQRSTDLAQFPEALQILERTQRWLVKLPIGTARHDAQIEILLRQERLCETLGLRTRQQQIIDELIALLDPMREQEELAEAFLRQGDLFTLLRRFGDAEAALMQALHIRQELGDSVGERNTLRSLGLLRWHESRNSEALDFAEQSLRIDRQRQDRAGIVGDLTNIGAILRALGDHVRAESVLEEALELSQTSGRGAEPGQDDELAVKRVYALKHLANIYRERGDRVRALDCLYRAGELAQQKRLPIQLSYLYTSVAHVHLLEGDIERCLEYYREAVDLTRKAKCAPGLAYSLSIRGEVLLGLERFDEAAQDLTEAAAVFAQLKDSVNEALMWQKIADALERADDAAGAAAAWSRAVALHRLLGDVPHELQALEGLGRSTRAQRAVGTALVHFGAALGLAQRLDDAAAEGRLRNTIGILEWERGNFAVALHHYELALEIFRSCGNQVHAGLMRNSIGATLKAMGRLDEARETLEQAVAIHRTTAHRQLEGHALAALADIAAVRGDINGAETHYRASLAIRRALQDRTGEGWMLYGLARCGLMAASSESTELLMQAAAIAQDTGDLELAGACARLRHGPTDLFGRERSVNAEIHHRA